MIEGKVEETFYPRNPLDVLAQQIVAIAAGGPDRRRRPLRASCAARRRSRSCPAAPSTACSTCSPGRYPSDEFAELRPRDHVGPRSAGRSARARARAASRSSTAGTIPDRGLYGVFLAGDDRRSSRRVGELDEEMVFESRAGEVFLLGASSWRIDEITHDRVLVYARAGRAGQDALLARRPPGRPPEFGARDRAARARARRGEARRGRSSGSARRARPRRARRAEPRRLPGRADGGDRRGAERPDDRRRALPRRDRRLARLRALAVRRARPRAVGDRRRGEAAARAAGEVEMLWSDDGMVFRLPRIRRAAGRRAASSRRRTRSRTSSCRRSARRRSSPRASARTRRARSSCRGAIPGKRSPLWAQRKRSADLLAVASRYGSFPMILETYRECLRDVFDLPGLLEILRRIEPRRIRVVTVESRVPSPFAAVAPLLVRRELHLRRRRAARRAPRPGALHRLTRSCASSSARPSCASCSIPTRSRSLERSLQRLDGSRIPRATPTALHDLLLSLGDLTDEEIRARSAEPEAVAGWIEALARERRIVPLSIAGERRCAAAEDAARYPRRARGRRSAGPSRRVPRIAAAIRSGDLVSRYARTHGPFLAESAAARFDLPRRAGPRSRSSGSPRRAASSRGSSCPAAGRASGATPRCCGR